MLRKILPAFGVVLFTVCGATRPSGEYQIRFGQELRLQSDVRLSGPSASRTVAFRCDSRLRPVAGSELHLFLNHAPNLDPDRSYLSVNLNYGVLRSIRLDERDENTAEVVIPLPPDLLKFENQLVFSADQVSTGGAAADTWTAIGVSSYLRIQYERERTGGDLRLLPSPLLDPYSYEVQNLDVLVPERISTESLEAAALLVANFANRLPPGSVAIHAIESLDEADDPVLLAGTPAEQGALREFPQAAGAGLAERDSLPVLYVTGDSPAAVLHTARGLFAPRLTHLKPRQWKGFIPAQSRFTLAELGSKDLKLDASDGFSVAVPLKSTPDSRFFERGPQMTLWLDFKPAAPAPGCTLAVEWNGTLIREIAVKEISRSFPASLSVVIPGGLTAAQNTLRVSLRGTGSDAQVTGFLLPDTQFYLPRDYRAELPDLALLRHSLYPFTLQADLSDAIVILPDSIHSGTFAALLELSKALGSLAPAGAVAFRVRRLSDMVRSDWSGANLIFLDPFGKPPEQVFPYWPRSGPGAPEESAVRLQEVVSPWNPRGFALSITAGEVPLRQAVEQIFTRGTLNELSGDTAYLTGSGPVCLNASRRRVIEESFYLTHLEAWMRVNWMALPLILALVSAVMFVGVRLALDRYKSAR